MPVLRNSKHERFAQSVAKGETLTASAIYAGYAKVSARKNAPRLMANDGIVSRIKELKTAVADRVVACAIRQRSWRVQQLQDLADDMLALRAARKKLYAGQHGEGYEFQVADATAEAAALAQGCHEIHGPVPADQPAPVGKQPYPKTMAYPGFPIGGESGMLIKDYRGKNAEQEIWKFDAALVEKFCHTLKQAAIEEGQWSEKREQAPEAPVPVRVTVVFVTPPAIQEEAPAIDVSDAPTGDWK